MRWMVSFFLGIVLVVLAGCTSSSPPANNATPRPPSPGAPAMSPRPPAAATPAPQAQALRISADGRLSFAEHRKLTFRTSGIVDAIRVKEQEKVTRGQVLARLDTTSLDQAVKTAELGVKAAELALKTVEIEGKQAQDSIKSLQIDLDMATDDLRKLTYPFTYRTFALDIPTALSRISSALGQVEEAQKNLQTATTADQYNQAARQLRDAKENLVTARESLARGSGQDPFIAGEFASGASGSGLLGARDFWTVRAAQLKMDKAQTALDNAQSLVDKAQLNLNKAKNDVDKAANELDKAKVERDKAIIVAPIDGVVARIGIEAGDFLSSANYATTVAVEIVDPRRMELIVKVNELDIPNVKVGQKVTVRVDAMPDLRIESAVTEVRSLPVTDYGVMSYEVKIAFDTPQDSALKAGMAATAEITTDKPKNAPPAAGASSPAT